MASPSDVIVSREHFVRTIRIPSAANNENLELDLLGVLILKSLCFGG